MKKLLFSLFIGFSFLLTFAENDSTITIQEIWKDYAYFPKSAPSFNWFSDTTYTVLEGTKGEQVILEYGVTSKSIVDTIYSSKNRISSDTVYDLNDKIKKYLFNKDRSHALLLTNSSPLYRRSTSYVIYIYDIKNDEIVYSTFWKAFNPTFSPDGEKLAYTDKNNLFVYDIEKKKETQITSDGKWNEVINGRADWVYEEEFSFSRAFEWSPASDKIAFMRFDESQVKEYNMQVWGDGLYPKDDRFKYPKAGEENSKVNIVYYDLTTQKTKKVYEGKDDYVPRIYWMNEEVISYQWLNRQQNDWKLINHNISKEKTTTVLEEKNNTYVEVSDIQYGKKTLFYTSEKNGFNHIYSYSFDKHKSTQLTKGKWEVSSIDFIDKKREHIYYTSTEFSSMERHPFKIDLFGKKKIDRLRTALLGVVPEYRGKGIDALLTQKAIENGTRRELTQSELSWVLGTNREMIRLAERIGGTLDKTYRMYRKEL